MARSVNIRGCIAISLWVRIDAGNGARCLNTVLKFFTSEFVPRVLSGYRLWSSRIQVEVWHGPGGNELAEPVFHVVHDQGTRRLLSRTWVTPLGHLTPTGI